MTPETARGMASAGVDPRFIDDLYGVLRRDDQGRVFVVYPAARPYPMRDADGRPRLTISLGEPYEPPYRPPWYVPQPAPEQARPKIGGWVPEIQPRTRPPWWRRGIFTPLSPEARERKLQAEMRSADRRRCCR